jgi:hypothetical protein
MIDCDELLASVLLGRRLDAEAAAHVERCGRCRAEEPVVQAVSQVLAAWTVPEPPAGLGERILLAAAPALARNAQVAWRPGWREIAGAVAVALLLLPVVVTADAMVLRAVYDGLRTILPGMLSAYLVLSYTALVTLLLGATYAAVPVLAAHQARLRWESCHA